MREIKFRAYDKEAGEMIYSDQQYDNYFFEFKDGKLCAFAIREDQGTIHEPPQQVVEELDSLDEYIGHKDKNGKEIYESDKVKWGHPNHHGKFMGTVIYDSEQGCFMLGDSYRYEHDEIEIIGNEYES